MVKFGYHIDTASISYEISLEAARQSGADYHLIMNDSGSFFFRDGEIATIRKWLQDLPNCNLIWRNFHRLEGNWSLYPNASEYEKHWKYLRSQLGDSLMSRIIIDDPCNEPNLAGADRIAAKAYVARCVALVRAAHNAGVKLAVGAWSIGTPHESLFENEYLPLWQALSVYKQGISCHLYGAIPFEAGELAPYSIILDAKTARNAMQGKWPIQHKGWLMARPYRIIELFRELNLGIPEIYITECIVDQISDMGMEVKEAWKAKYGIDKYQRDPRGILAWERYLAEMIPGPLYAALNELLAHARKNIFYHPAFKAACLFAMNAQWGYPNGSNKEAGSNYNDPALDHFRSQSLYLVNTTNDPTLPHIELPEDKAMPEMIPARIRSTVEIGTNVRSLASINGAILGRIPRLWQEINITVEKDWESKTWVYLEIGQLKGYSSKEWLEIVPVVVTPPPPPSDEPEYEVDFTIRMTESVRAAFREIADSLANAKLDEQ